MNSAESSQSKNDGNKKEETPEEKMNSELLQSKKLRKRETLTKRKKRQYRKGVEFFKNCFSSILENETSIVVKGTIIKFDGNTNSIAEYKKNKKSSS